jgi:hypothetical protein
MRERGTGTFSPSVPDAALSPDTALDYLAELSTDIRSAVVLDGTGERLAGPESLAGPARDLLAACDAPVVEVETPQGLVVAARSASHAIAVVAGRQALAALVRWDVRHTVGELEPKEPRELGP